MKSRRFVLSVLALIFVGCLAGYAVQAQAQSETCGGANGAWDVVSGASAVSRTWYAVKLNRCTGEAWVLSAEGSVNDDKWLMLPSDRIAPVR